MSVLQQYLSLVDRGLLPANQPDLMVYIVSVASHFAGVVNGIACYSSLLAVGLCPRVFESLR